MSGDIQKGPVSPLSAEHPLAPTDRPGTDDRAGPPFPRTMGAGGAIWIVAGALLFLLVPPLLYVVWPRFQYLLHGIAYPLDLALLFCISALLIVAALSGAIFIRAGIRILRGVGPARPGIGLGVYSLVAGLLLSVVSQEPATLVWGLLFGPPRPPGTQWNMIVVVPYIMFAVVSVPAGLLLLTGGALALAGRSRYERWRKAQEFGRWRGGTNADNPFRK